MDDRELETEAQSIENATELLDRLFAVADGDRPMVIGQYDASTILALLMDKAYRKKVKARLHDFDDLTGDE